MATYEEVRQKQVEGAYSERINDFLDDYDASKPTVVLLPGLQGSELLGSRRPWTTLTDFNPSHYKTLWGNQAIQLHFPKLELDADLREPNIQEPDGSVLDPRITVPGGEFRFDVLGWELIKPYGNFIDFVTRTKKWNCFVVGYDWRFSIEYNGKWLAWIFERILQKLNKGVEFFETFHVVGHSMGGIVAKAFLDRVYSGGSTAVRSWPGTVITLGSPFYGSVLPTYTLFKGNEHFNDSVHLDRVPRIVSTMPGFPDVMLLPLGQYQALRAQFDKELKEYPVTSNGTPFDIFTQAAMDRLPVAFGLNTARILNGLNGVIRRGTPLPTAAAERMYNLRARKNDKTSVGFEWPASAATWEPVPGEGTPAPLLMRLGEGDGTVPYYAARLLGVPPDHVVDLDEADQHGSLHNDEEARENIVRIVES